MTTVTEMMPFAGTIGGGFLGALLAGYAIKKVMKIVGVIIGVFIAALAYMQYQRIIEVNWAKLQAVSQNGITIVQCRDSYIKHYRRGSYRSIIKSWYSINR